MTDPRHVVNKGDKPSAETVGLVWVDVNGKRWTQIAYCGVPTVDFESEDAAPERLSVAMGSPVADSFELAPDNFETMPSTPEPRKRV